MMPQLVVYQVRILLESVRLQANFPCTMSVEHRGDIMTAQVPGKEGVFIFDGELELKGTTSDQYIELAFLFNSSKAREAGCLHLQLQSLHLRRGQQVANLKRCYDREANCKFQILSSTTRKEPKSPIRTNVKVRQGSKRQEQFQTKTEYGGGYKERWFNGGRGDKEGQRWFKEKEGQGTRSIRLDNEDVFKKKKQRVWESGQRDIQVEMTRQKGRTVQFERILQEKSVAVRRLNEQLNEANKQLSEMNLRMMQASGRQYELVQLEGDYGVVCENLREERVKVIQLQGKLQSARQMQERTLASQRTQMEYREMEHERQIDGLRMDLQGKEAECVRRTGQVDKLRKSVEQLEQRLKEKCLYVEKTISSERSKHMEVQQVHVEKIHQISNKLQHLEKEYAFVEDSLKQSNVQGQQMRRFITGLQANLEAALGSCKREQESNRGLVEERRVLHSRISSFGQTIERNARTIEMREKELADFKALNEQLGNSNKSKMSELLQRNHSLGGQVEEQQNVIKDMRVVEGRLRKQYEQCQGELREVRERERGLAVEVEQRVKGMTNEINEWREKYLALQVECQVRREELRLARVKNNQWEDAHMQMNNRYEIKMMEYGMQANKLVLLQEGIGRYKQMEMQHMQESRVLHQKISRAEESVRELTCEKEREINEIRVAMEEVRARVQKEGGELKAEVGRLQYQNKELTLQLQAVHRKLLDQQGVMRRGQVQIQKYMEKVEQLERERGRMGNKLMECQGEVVKGGALRQVMEQSCRKLKEEVSALRGQLHLVKMQGGEEMRNAREDNVRLSSALAVTKQEGEYLRDSVENIVRRALRLKQSSSLENINSCRSSRMLSRSRMSRSRGMLNESKDIVESLQQFVDRMNAVNHELEEELRFQKMSFEQEMKEMQQKGGDSLKQTFRALQQINLQRNSLIDALQVKTVEYNQRSLVHDNEYSNMCRRVVQLQQSLQQSEGRFQMHYAELLRVSQVNRSECEKAMGQRDESWVLRGEMEERNARLVVQLQERSEELRRSQQQRSSMGRQLGQLKEQMLSERERGVNLKEILQKEEQRQNELKSTSQLSVRQREEMLNAKLEVEGRLQESEVEKSELRTKLMEAEIRVRETARQLQTIANEVRGSKIRIGELEEELEEELEGRKREQEMVMVRMQALSKEREKQNEELKRSNGCLVEQMRGGVERADRLQEELFLQRQNMFNRGVEEVKLREQLSRVKAQLKSVGGVEQEIEANRNIIRKLEERLEMGQEEYGRRVREMESVFREKMEQVAQESSLREAERNSLNVIIESLREELEHESEGKRKVIEQLEAEEQRGARQMGEVEREKISIVAERKKEVGKLQEVNNELRNAISLLEMREKSSLCERVAREEQIVQLQEQISKVEESLCKASAKHSAQIQVEREKRSKLQSIFDSFEDSKWEAKQCVKKIIAQTEATEDIMRVQNEVLKIINEFCI